MKASFAFAASLAFCLPAFAQQKTVGWSLGYYCGWDQDGGFKPSQIDWKAFTHISHFTVFPNNDGSLDVNSNGLSDANCKAAVSEAHKNGVKIVFCIGGAQAKDRFKNACAPENIHKFVKNLLDFMRKYGYDGIDTDWEENFDDAKMVAWHKELRDSLNNITPRPSLTVAGGGYFAAHCAIVHPYIDFLNTMSYDVAMGGMPNELREFTSRGFPKEKLGIGIGIGGGGSMVDVDSATAKKKVQFVFDNGLGGIMQWAVTGAARNVQIFRMLEQYRPATPTVIYADGRLQVINDPGLAVYRNTLTGRSAARYRVAGDRAAWVELGLFDARGALRRSVFRGLMAPGSHELDLGPVPGPSFLRYTQVGNTAAARGAAVNP
jgi:hypothetical protein